MSLNELNIKRGGCTYINIITPIMCVAQYIKLLQVCNKNNEFLLRPTTAPFIFFKAVATTKVFL
jgi:hypothetical protein